MNANTTSSSAMTVADALTEALAEWNIGPVYGVSGANIEHFHDAIHRRADPRLWSVPAKSESSAAFMADAQVRMNGGLGVCCSTSGGAMLNLAVGVAEAYQEGIPMLAVVGQPPTQLSGQGAFQDSSGLVGTVDAKGMWTAVSKHVECIESGDRFWGQLADAVRAALSGRCGPSVLLVARDVFSQPVPPKPSIWPTHPADFVQKPQLDAALLAKLEAALIRAKRPVAIVGSEVRRVGATRDVAEWVEALNVPVVTTMADLAAYSHDSDLYLGMIGTAGHPSAHRYINERADLVISIGSQLEFMIKAPIQAGLERAQVFTISSDTSRVKATVPSCSGLDGSISEILGYLKRLRFRCNRSNGRPADYSLERFVPQLADAADQSPAHEKPLLQSEAIATLNDALPSGGQVLFDAGNCAASALHYLSIPADTSTTIALGMGGMGYAIGAAIGAQLGSPVRKRTTVLCGDGAFMLAGMEVHTAVDLGLPITFVVFNNGKHGMCMTRQQLFFEGRVECSEYARPRIADLARGFGSDKSLWTGSASSKDELDAVLEDLSKWNWAGPAVIELDLAVEEMPPFAPFLGADAPTYGAADPAAPSLPAPLGARAA